MIFNSRIITKLVSDWKSSRDPDILGEIITGSTRLAEVIVSRYPSDCRDDMIQECLARVPYAIQHYDENVADLHKYLTSVFTNRCNSYISYENRQQRLTNDLGYLHEAITIDVYDIREELSREVIIRNRKRFPTIPVNLLDDISVYILDCILNGMSVKGKARGAIAHITQIYGVKRNEAIVLYHSTLVYLRTRYSSFVTANIGDPPELSLLPDLKDILGEEAYARISIIFSGLHFRVP